MTADGGVGSGSSSIAASSPRVSAPDAARGAAAAVDSVLESRGSTGVGAKAVDAPELHEKLEVLQQTTEVVTQQSEAAQRPTNLPGQASTSTVRFNLY